MDIFKTLGAELRSVFHDLFDEKRRGVVKQKMAQIVEDARRIGGTIAQEAERLERDVLRYLEKPTDEKRKEIVKAHALRLEQQMGEI
jgi:hypothetical protein